MVSDDFDRRSRTGCHPMIDQYSARSSADRGERRDYYPFRRARRIGLGALLLLGARVGAGHRFADKIGSKVPAIVNANIGYASGTTDAGQPWYQDGSFAFLSDGKVNAEAFRDFSVRAMVEQAVKTRQLVSLYYGKAPKFSYYDGHSQGGRQGYKIVQEYPELYDGYMIAEPALSIPMFGTTALYAQIVMKTDLGY